MARSDKPERRRKKDEGRRSTETLPVAITTTTPYKTTSPNKAHDMAPSTADAVPSRNDAAPGKAVLFVCLGNICRSPMAEGIFRHLTNFATASQHPLISRIDSCGTGAYHTGNQPDSRTLTVLEQNGITGFCHEARRIDLPSDFEDFDYVLAMDEDNLARLKDMHRRARRNDRSDDKTVAKVMLYGDVVGGGEIVNDPYYGGSNGFEKAYEQLTRFGKALLDHVESQANESSSGLKELS